MLITKKQAGCMVLLAMMGNVPASADDALWVDMGAGIYTDTMGGVVMDVNWMPGEWGMAVRAGSYLGIGHIFECMLNFNESACNETLVTTEVGLLAMHEYDGGNFIASAGISKVSLDSGLNGQDKDIYGIPFSLIWRTERWALAGFSLSLSGNVNQEQSFIGLNGQLELGVRFRTSK